MAGTLTLLVSALAMLLSLSSTPQPDSVPASFGSTTPFVLGDVPMLASIANTPQERQLGLSNTVSLPPSVAKVFVFEESSLWAFWMKDMNYAIDIFWISEEGVVVHIEPNVPPESYPNTFAPVTPARYVVETVAGFAEQHGIVVGDTVEIDAFLAL